MVKATCSECKITYSSVPFGSTKLLLQHVHVDVHTCTIGSIFNNIVCHHDNNIMLMSTC